MKINRRVLVVGTILIIAFIFFLQKSREANLPNGKVTETKPVDFINIESEPIQGRPQVEVNTTKGIFIVELRPDLAQKSVVNFLQKWNNGYCDGTVFHRVEDWVIQGCDPEGTGLGGKNILPTEKSTESFLVGSVGVARKPYPEDVSNDSQFFIVKKDSKFLDGEYTYLGRVISGMEVVNNVVAGDDILSTNILTK